MPESIQVVHVASEFSPYTRPGPLGGMVAGLTQGLAAQGADVRVIMPWYRRIREAGVGRLIRTGLQVPLGADTLRCNLREARTPGGVGVWFIEREDLFDRPKMYGSDDQDYYDNLERMSFLAQAALLAIQSSGTRAQVVHCHDWQAGLVPALLKGPFRRGAHLQGLRSLFTIHNMGFQGTFPASKVPVTGLPAWEFFNADGMEYWGGISLLKAGIVYADALTTVSPTYAKEIQTGEIGMGMEGVVYNRRHVLRGILNGLDHEAWDPSSDHALSNHYSVEDLSGKKMCKEALIRAAGMDPALLDRPILSVAGLVNRRQKGFELVLDGIQDLMALDVGLVVALGPNEGNGFQELALRYPGRVTIFRGADEVVLRRVLSGADIVLLPAAYAPCGMMQIRAMHYGTVPVARDTGGLRDTIQDVDLEAGTGTGFLFQPFKTVALRDATNRAIGVWTDQDAWQAVMRRGMAARFSWEQTASAYMEQYRELAEGPVG